MEHPSRTNHVSGNEDLHSCRCDLGVIQDNTKQRVWLSWVPLLHGYWWKCWLHDFVYIESNALTVRLFTAKLSVYYADHDKSTLNLLSWHDTECCVKMWTPPSCIYAPLRCCSGLQNWQPERPRGALPHRGCTEQPLPSQQSPHVAPPVRANLQPRCLSWEKQRRPSRTPRPSAEGGARSQED